MEKKITALPEKKMDMVSENTIIMTCFFVARLVSYLTGEMNELMWYFPLEHLL